MPDPRVRQKHILELEGHKLWLVHEGPYIPISVERITSWWRHRTSPEDGDSGKPDIIVAGHEHSALIERCDGILYVNSGSPTLLNYQPGPGTVGILELSPGKAEARIIHL